MASQTNGFKESKVDVLVIGAGTWLQALGDDSG